LQFAQVVFEWACPWLSPVVGRKKSPVVKKI